MFNFFYNFFLGLYFIFLFPKVLSNLPKYRSTILDRFFFKAKRGVNPEGRKTIWIHAVSLGEMKVAALLANKIKEEEEKLFLVVSTSTKTGFAEAKKAISFADYHLFLPLDFSRTMNKLVSFFKPRALILVETDFWYNFMWQVKKWGGAVLLINGKLSSNSFKRHKFFPFFSRKIFSLIDLFCIQNEIYEERFIKLGVPKEKIHITGNLKLDLKNEILSQEEKEKWKKAFKLGEKKVITIASTHDPEEFLILKKISPSYKYFLAPRHPERFLIVKEILKKLNIPFGLYSQKELLDGSERVILIDTMGLLNICYQLSSLAIIGGSFTKKVGGHNILEPIFVHTPVFFGPFMQTQQELKSLSLEAQCAKEVTLSALEEEISSFFATEFSIFQKNCQKLKRALSGYVEKTHLLLKNYY
jgi:3-deoxy-D-manno-octulosonic-acid transferase